MMKVKCVKLVYSSGSLKLFTAYEIRCDTRKQQDCNECKHQLACLVNPECDRTFESK